MLGGGRDQALELGERAELRGDRRVAALGRPDRPRASGVAGRRDERVVPALAVGDPDRVDRGEVDDVEAELGQLRQDGLDAGETAERAREELVPGAEGRALAVDDQPERLGQRRLRFTRQVGLGRQRLLNREALHPEDRRALGELGREVGLARVELPLELVAPRGEPVDPRRDRVLPAPEGLDRKRPAPAVVEEWLHRRLDPLALARLAVSHDRPHDVVALREHGGAHLERAAGRALHRVSAAVEARRDLLDLDPRRPFLRRRAHPCPSGHVPLWRTRGQVPPCAAPEETSMVGEGNTRTRGSSGLPAVPRAGSGTETKL